MKTLLILFVAIAAVCNLHAAATITLYPANASPINYSDVTSFQESDHGISFQSESQGTVRFVGSYLLKTPKSEKPLILNMCIDDGLPYEWRAPQLFELSKNGEVREMVCEGENSIETKFAFIPLKNTNVRYRIELHAKKDTDGSILCEVVKYQIQPGAKDLVVAVSKAVIPFDGFQYGKATMADCPEFRKIILSANQS
jgi:hypothetical protein